MKPGHHHNFASRRSLVTDCVSVLVLTAAISNTKSHDVACKIKVEKVKTRLILGTGATRLNSIGN